MKQLIQPEAALSTIESLPLKLLFTAFIINGFKIIGVEERKLFTLQ